MNLSRIAKMWILISSVSSFYTPCVASGDFAPVTETEYEFEGLTEHHLLHQSTINQLNNVMRLSSGSTATAFLLPLISLTFLAGTDLWGQTTSIWEKAWETASTYSHDSPFLIDDLGRGRYAIASEWGIEVTDDGGVTWKNVHRYSIDDAIGSGTFYMTKVTDISLAAPDHIVATLDSTLSIPGGSVEVSIVKVTTDGGTTWHYFSPGEDYRFTHVSMFDDRGGVAVARHRGDGPDLLFHTYNGGFDWDPISFPEGVRYARDIHVLGQAEWGMRAYDTVSRSDYFYRTDDAGETWNRSPESLPSIRRLRFVTPAIAWGVARMSTGVGHTQRDVIRKSVDGGMTWHTVLDTVLDFRFGLADIDFADADNGIAVGPYAKILRTTDGGETWVQEWPPSDLISEYIGLVGISFTAPDEALVVAGGGTSIAWRGGQTLVAPTIIEPAHNFLNHPTTTTLRWAPIEGATHYDVQVGDTTYEYDIVAHEVFNDPYIEETGLTGTSLELELEPHVRYAIRVRARGGDLVSDWSVRLNLLTQGDEGVLASPYFTSPEMGAKDQPLDVELSWSGIAGAIGYDLQVGTDPAFFVSPMNWNNLPGTSHLVTGLSANTTYYAQVRARNAEGVTSRWSSNVEGALIFITAKISSGGGTDIAFSAEIRPNVTADIADIVIRASGPEVIDLSVIDLQGVVRLRRSLWLGESGEHRRRLDLEGLPPGRYVVVLERARERYRLPVLILR